MKVSEEYVLLSKNAKKLKYHWKLTSTVAIIYDLIMLDAIHIGKDGKLIVKTYDISKLKDYEIIVYNMIARYKEVKLYFIILRIYLTLQSKEINTLIQEKLMMKQEEKDDIVSNIIEGMRAEVLEEGTISEETAVLVLLLKQSKCLKYYFSKYEEKAMFRNLSSLKYTEQYIFYNIYSRTVAIADILTWS